MLAKPQGRYSKKHHFGVVQATPTELTSKLLPKVIHLIGKKVGPENSRPNRSLSQNFSQRPKI